MKPRQPGPLLRAGAQIAKAAVRLLSRDRPVSPNKIRALSALLGDNDVLLSSAEGRFPTGRALRNPYLARLLSHIELGGFALGPRTLNWLEKGILQTRPELVLEFGAGISTVCLAQYMSEVHPEDSRNRLLTIEQDNRFAARTAELLESCGLSHVATVVICELREQEVEGYRTTCYDLPVERLRNILGNSRPDFVLVDGPAAESGARFGTLPLIHEFLRDGTHFVLDDALRVGELEVADRWNRLSYIDIDGIHLWEKGLLVGRVRSVIRRERADSRCGS